MPSTENLTVGAGPVGLITSRSGTLGFEFAQISSIGEVIEALALRQRRADCWHSLEFVARLRLTGGPRRGRLRHRRIPKDVLNLSEGPSTSARILSCKKYGTYGAVVTDSCGSEGCPVENDNHEAG